MDWHDISIERDEADFPAILGRWWSWLLVKPYRPIMMTVFGDWFLLDQAGKAYFLDLLEGKVAAVANSQEELKARMSDERNQDNWFLPGFVTAMQRAGVPRPPGKCYAYRIHPIIGGEVKSSNLLLLDIEVWQAICSQIHEQVRLLPVNTRVQGFEHLDGFAIRLVTDG